MPRGNKELKVLITGGSGFLGSAIVEEFLSGNSILNVPELRIFDLKHSEHAGHPKVNFVKGNICDEALVSDACKDVDLVIHSAAIVDWGTKSKEEVLNINVGGTENVIKGCKENGVKNLIYTSSLDAIFGGKPLRNIDESIPYPEKHITVYCESKYLAEKKVLEEKGDDLNVVILRPSDIYGERDPYHIGSLIDMAKQGFYVRLGDGKSKCQHVYVRNMAHAHLLAAREMLNGNQSINGQVYFITDGPGSNFFKFFDKVVEGAGYRIWPKNLWLPRWFAYSIGSVSELMAVLARPVKKYNPKFSRFAVVYTCSDFTFTSDKARMEIGYIPKYSEEEALRMTIDYYKKEKEN